MSRSGTVLVLAGLVLAGASLLPAAAPTPQPKRAGVVSKPVPRLPDPRRSDRESRLATSPSTTEGIPSPVPRGEPFFVPLDSAPYPYSGPYADTKVPFFNAIHQGTGEPCHTNRYGERIPASRYRDNRVLFYLPRAFAPGRPFVYLVFFHELPSDPHRSFAANRLAGQVEAAGRNLVLVLPPLASNANDSSPGKFFVRDAFRIFLGDVGTTLAKHFPEVPAGAFRDAPVVVAAFSGGYKAVAYVLDRGGCPDRIAGVLLFDALYEDVDKFQTWLAAKDRRGTFLHLFGSGSCQSNSLILMEHLRTLGRPFSTRWPKGLLKGSTHFIRVRSKHPDIPVLGPPDMPLARALALMSEVP